MFTADSKVIRTWQDKFPVKAHSGGRYLLDNHGLPFPVLGRVCWMIMRMNVADYTTVLDDTRNKGFNAIEMKAPITPSVDNGTGRDFAGNLPFQRRLDGATWTGTASGFSNINNEAPDFTTPTEAYWLNVDAFFLAAEQRGILCFFFPAYVGFNDTDWWMGTEDIMSANGATKMGTYGAWIANRYRYQRNLVWMVGGDKGPPSPDFDAGELAVETAFIAGLKSIPTMATGYAAEWRRGSINTDLFASSITVNGTYAAFDDINNQGSRAWAISPSKPAFVQEAPFDNGSAGIMRRITAWSFMSTIGGYLFGVEALLEPMTDAKMNTVGTLDAARFNKWIVTFPWYNLVPTNSAITSGGGTPNSDTQVVAAKTATGTLMLIYIPPAHTGTVTIDMSLMAGSTLARWWDGSTGNNGVYTTDSSGIAASGTHVFTRPGNNVAGDADWWLVLTA